jgi:cell division transport system permease protein
MALLMSLFYILDQMLETIEISFQLEMFAILFLIILGLGVVITWISTWFALTKYLRMKLDDLY